MLETHKTDNGPVVLTQVTLLKGVSHLADRDPCLAGIVNRLGPPPMWERQPGFPTLIHIILEQQVSLRSAQAAFNRLIAAVSPLTPEGFLLLTDSELKAIGFSRQKTVYGRLLAQAIIEGRLDLEGLGLLPDDRVRSELMKIKGIGRWTSDIYLLMALKRQDIWPRGDLALAVAIQKIKGLSMRPTEQEIDVLSQHWRPWRAVAARVLWHFYLS